MATPGRTPSCSDLFDENTLSGAAAAQECDKALKCDMMDVEEEEEEHKVSKPVCPSLLAKPLPSIALSCPKPATAPGPCSSRGMTFVASSTVTVATASSACASPRPSACSGSASSGLVVPTSMHISQRPFSPSSSPSVSPSPSSSSATAGPPCPKKPCLMQELTTVFASGSVEEQLNGCLDLMEKKFVAHFGSANRMYQALQQRIEAREAQVYEFLPNELFLHILGFLLNDPNTLARMSLVCRNWYTLINRPCVWKKVCARKWQCQNVCQISSRLFQIVGQAEYHPSLVDIAPLIKAGAPISSIYGPQKVTPLLMAAFHGHLSVVKFLVKCGASFKEKSVYGRSALHCAAWGGHNEVVAWLYHNGCDPTERDQFGHTPMLCAAMSGSRATCAWLHSQGAQLTEKNNLGLTPLHCACFAGSVDLVTWMLQKGANIGERSASHDTPLLCACRNAQLSVVKCLLQKGASFAETTNIGENGVMLAALGKAPPTDTRYAELVAYILQRGLLNVAATDEYGCTALHMARMARSAHVTQVLVEHGASETVRDRFGATPSDSANILDAVRGRQKGRLLEILQNITGIVLKFSVCNRDNTMTDFDLRFLCESLAETPTIHTLVLLNTHIDVRKSSGVLVSLAETNRCISHMYFGEREEHRLSKQLTEMLRENERRRTGLLLSGAAGPGLLQVVQLHAPLAGQQQQHQQQQQQQQQHQQQQQQQHQQQQYLNQEGAQEEGAQQMDEES